MNNVSTLFACVIRFGHLGMNHDGGISTLEVLAFVRDHSCNVARGQSETRAESGKSRNEYGNHHFQDKFCFVRHTDFIEFRLQRYYIFLIYAREREIFFTFCHFFHENYYRLTQMRRAVRGKRAARVDTLPRQDPGLDHARIWAGSGEDLGWIWRGYDMGWIMRMPIYGLDLARL